MLRLVQVLRSARFALAVLVYLGTYTFVCAWLPWGRADATPAPAWALATGFDHPFLSPLFLAGCVGLFASTLACTWGRRARIAAVRSGQLPATAVVLPARAGRDVGAFLREEGFGGAGPVLRRYGPALWGGWILHVGLLVLIAAVLVQQAFHDGGAFELAQGEQLLLSTPGATFGRERGVFAPAEPPALDVGLLQFDPFLHQHGYAPDRLSRLRVSAPGVAPAELTLDRATGVTVGGVDLYQAIPTGLALVVEVPGLGTRAIHLRGTGDRRAGAWVTAPSGEQVHFSVEADRPLVDPSGTGALVIRLTQAATPTDLTPGQPFAFGATQARLVAVTRWAGFTWARSPGLPFVFLGFAVVLLGAALLAFPAAVACLSPGDDGVAARVSGRGAELLANRWPHAEASSSPPPSG